MAATLKKFFIVLSVIAFSIAPTWVCVEAQDGEGDQGAERRLPELKPGEWQPLFEVGESIYPSFVISTATLKGGLWEDNDTQHLGDSWGVIGIAVRGTTDNCPVWVEISGEGFIKPSAFTGSLIDKDTVYCVYPDIKYDYDKLLGVKQTVPEMVSFKVRIGTKSYPVRTIRVQVRPVNECVSYFVDSSGASNDVSYLFAAYVNENHPFISQILKEAIQSGKIDSFDGYAGDADTDAVRAQIEAVWKALQDRGIRYSAMPASADDDDPFIGTQYVRLLGESINYAQANCVDGSVLMASIFRKLGLDVSLVELPDHMFINVALDKDGKENVFIETTELGSSAFDEALESGRTQYEEAKDRFDSDKDDDQSYNIINIQNARRMGIMPIKDSSAARIAEIGNRPVRASEDESDD